MVVNDNGLFDRFLISLLLIVFVFIFVRMEGSRNLRNINFILFERLYERFYAKYNTVDRVKYGFL